MDALPGAVVVKGGGVYGGGCSEHRAARCIVQCAAGWTFDSSSGHSGCSPRSLAPQALGVGVGF